MVHDNEAEVAISVESREESSKTRLVLNFDGLTRGRDRRIGEIIMRDFGYEMGGTLDRIEAALREYLGPNLLVGSERLPHDESNSIIIDIKDASRTVDLKLYTRHFLVNRLNLTVFEPTGDERIGDAG